MSTTTIGDPTVWPAGIRTPTGTDPRNATTEAAICTDVANGLAWLRARGPDRMLLTLADLSAKTGVVPGDACHVKGYGWYYYTTSAVAVYGSLIIGAVGMGTGFWIHDSIAALLHIEDGITGYRVQKALVPYAVLESGALFSDTPLITGTITAGASLLDTTHVVSVANTQVGDIIQGVFGPLLLSTPSTTNPGFRGRVDVECVSGYTTGGGVTEVCRSVTVGILGGYVQTHEISWRAVVSTPGTALVRMRFTAPDDVTFAATCMDRYWYGNYEARRP